MQFIQSCSVQDVKILLAAQLAMPDFWHDRFHAYPAAETTRPTDIMLFPEWHPCSDATPDWLLAEEVPDEDECEAVLGHRNGEAQVAAQRGTLLALCAFFEKWGISTEPTLDLMYCRRPQTG